MKTQKNLMSKIALLSLLFFFVGMTTTFAQKRGGQNDDNSTPTEKAEKKSQKWKTDFSLNDTQTALVKASLEKQITATEALREEKKGKDHKAKMETIMFELDTEVQAIFTAEQYTAYEKMKEEKEEKKEERGGRGGRGGHGGQGGHGGRRG